MRDKLNEEKLAELKKLHETPENCSTLAGTEVNQGVWNNLDETARSTDLKFQKVQKSLIKGMIVIVSVGNKLIPVSEAEDTSTEQEETMNKLMDGILLFANANQELNFRRRELLRPQLNASYRYLCAPSNPVTAELFGDDLPKAVKDITVTNRLTSKLTKDNYSPGVQAIDQEDEIGVVVLMGNAHFQLITTFPPSQKTTNAPFYPGSGRGRRRRQIEYIAG